MPSLINTIVISKIMMLNNFVGFLFSRVKLPISFAVPPKLIIVAWINTPTITNWASINVETLKISPKWCMFPYNLGLPSISCPTRSIPYACIYLHWLRWIAHAQPCVVFEVSYGYVVNKKPNSEDGNYTYQINLIFPWIYMLCLNHNHRSYSKS